MLHFKKLLKNKTLKIVFPALIIASLYGCQGSDEKSDPTGACLGLTLDTQEWVCLSGKKTTFDFCKSVAAPMFQNGSLISKWEWHEGDSC